MSAIKKIRARKRWQKAGETVCPKLNMNDIVSSELLDNYLKEGWGAITKNYKEKKQAPISPGKERIREEIDNNKTKTVYFDGLSEQQQKLTLEILGSVRKYLVEQIFRCQGKISDNEYFAAGSTNITSDYDLAITGPQANEIMWGMFKKFLKQYGEALPYAFDTNLYSSPLYIHTTHEGKKLDKVRNASETFPRVDYGKREFTLVPQTDIEMREELIWAGLKLLKHKSYIDNNGYPNLTSILSDSKKLQDHLDIICKTTPKKSIPSDSADIDGEDDTELERLLEGKLSDEMKKIIKNYYLQYKSQQVCQKYVYDKDSELPNKEILGEKKSIFYYSNKANYFSSEAYYTSSAVNSIVVEKQLKSKLNYGKRSADINKKVYITAAIENLGDMLHHMQHEKGNIKNTIIKYSKYLYRIYLVLGKAGSKEHEDYAKKIEDIVIPFRKTYDIEKANKEKIWIYVFYNENTDTDIKTYLEKLKGKLLSEIEKMFGTKAEKKGLKSFSSSPAIMESNKGGYKIKKKKKRKKTRRKKDKKIRIRIKTRKKK
tara:strand:+ start:126 stop:1754 length:1629 start_codon:yes stop_codon:yes gene_type:complete